MLFVNAYPPIVCLHTAIAQKLITICQDNIFESLLSSFLQSLEQNDKKFLCLFLFSRTMKDENVFFK
jgi:hypothetical protein